MKAIEDNEGVKRLTANPLLLTILALIHRNGEHLPERRVKLYDLAVQTLIEDWQLSKKLPDTPKVMLKETEVVQLLAPLAYWMHEEKPSGLVTQAEVEEKLVIELANLNDTNPKSNSVRQEVTQFLRKVRETTGLFIERTPGVYGFMHLTFEEYFAARYIADKDRSDILQLLEKHRYESRWDEPLLLTLGYYGNFSPTQLSKLLEILFSYLKKYEPVLQNGEIKIKNSSSNDAKIIWLKADSTGNLQQAELKLKDLLFAGQAIAEVDAKASFRKDLIQKLVLTYIGIDDNSEEDVAQQLLKLLRKIELFHQKTEVIDILKEIANDTTLSAELQIKAKTAILYIACGDLIRLIDYAVEIVNQLEPELFYSIMELMGELGEDITSSLEISQKRHDFDTVYQNILIFLTGISYVRKNKYEKAVEILEDIEEKLDKSFRSYLCWVLAQCYEESEKYEKANNYYYQSNLANYPQQNSLLIFWRHWGWCQRLDKKYEQSLFYYQKALALAEQILNFKHKANAFYNIARVYQDWGKYAQAIDYHQQSQELYQQLGRDKNVANQWSWMATCYREWCKYEQAIQCANQCLVLRQQLDDKIGVANAHNRLGRIYQAWGQHAQAINYYQQSREAYQQLG
ncbi:tetratricopeptide repeat protein, partial [Scytonema sp. NUACC26]|uniref:tetratricopeptide repeat protein n=1 Tax=Scytonema sp. NUACC26 TaxID=3140176 RepID=UPI0038B3C7F8